MSQYKFLLPKMGESVAEATIVKWLKNPGDNVEQEEIILEVATDKVDSEVPSPVKGKIVEILYSEGDIAQVGDIIAVIEIEGETNNKTVQPVIENIVEEQIPHVPAIEASNEEIITFIENHTNKDSGRFYSPLVKSIASEEGIDFDELDKIKGSGAEGRLTKDDLLTYLANKNQNVTETIKPLYTTESQANLVKPYKEEAITKASVPAIAINGGDEVIEMDRMRKLIADYMINSQRVSAHVSSFVEADVTNIVRWREQVKDNFAKREGEKITFTPIFIEAVAKAIKDFPMINVSVDGNKIIKKKDINIGMAAALPNGNLIVPVIKNADQLNLVGLTKSVNDLAKRSRANKLAPDEIKGGTFTITNIGMFGNIMGTPIINQPEVAILAVGVIKKKPAVIETEHGDMIGIRHMMYLSMSYDHRVVDGALGGMFVRKVADYLEQWDINREV